MDPLSDILSLLRVEGVLSARMEARGRWAMRFPAYRHMKFGGVIEGGRWIWVEPDQPVWLQAGDFYLLTDGRPYCVASDRSLVPIDGAALFESHMGDDGTVRYGNGGDRTMVAAGRFTFADDQAVRLLRLLPPVVHVPCGSPGSAPLGALLPLIGAEVETKAPGQLVAASSLANLVLVQILRAYLASGPLGPSWLAGMADPRIGAALCLMHDGPKRPWTVDQLARSVGMSRTAFSERFRARVGTPPLDYLTRWRMMMAANALRNGSQSLGEVADAVGYGSATAFSLAFKRETGRSPGRFRLQPDCDPRTTANLGPQ